MGLLSNIFGKKPSTIDPTAIEAKLKAHLENMSKADATGDPSDYIEGLEYMAPSEDLPLKKGVVFCACCLGPFYLDQFKEGFWFTFNERTKLPKPMCSYCLETIDRAYLKLNGHRVLNVAKSYDVVGHQLFEMNPNKRPAEIALTRILVMEKRLKQ